MYGMVNDGIRTFIVDAHGPDMWQKICATAQVDRDVFERMSSYDDAVTYGLVGAICEHTGMSGEDVLNVFGKFWVGFAGSSSFGELLRMSGNSFVERIRGLDDMHERILLSMPHLRPPSFEIEEVAPQVYDLFYYSEREGLAPMVSGLLEGLAAETGEKVKVTHTVAKAKVSDPDVFRVTLIV